MNQEYPYTKIIFEQKDEDGDVVVESVWASKVAEGYRIENIPFRITDVSFHDIVEAKIVEGALLAIGVIEESGHSTVRVFFTSDKLKETIDFLENQKCGIEPAPKIPLIAVTIPPFSDYTPIKAYLEEGEQKGFWEYEEGCIAH